MRTRRGIQKGDKEEFSNRLVEANYARTKPKALGKALATDTLLPIIRDICLTRMSRFEPFPMDGPAEPVYDNPRELVRPPRVPKHEHEKLESALPTTQMIKYKAKLKESGLKPIKQKRYVEQHVDDCGEGTSSLVGIASAVECYLDTTYECDDNAYEQCRMDRWGFDVSATTFWL